MQKVYPDYYKEFRCIAGECKNSCCIGWEIDIDEESLRRFEQTEGAFGERLRENISYEETPHFILGENERCPFLNADNLCDMILELGEDSICGICREHPRFYNELPGRIEAGLGLCCEEAARIILGKTDKTKLEISGEPEVEDEIIILRDEVISLLQERDKTIDSRCENVLALCGINLSESSIVEWTDFFLSLERMDEAWTRVLLFLKENAECVGSAPKLMVEHECEYEQLLVYLIYRHFANAPDLEEAALRAAFAVICFRAVRAVGAAVLIKNGAFALEDNILLCRLMSAELEYSDDNRNAILDKLAFDMMQ